MRAKPSLLASAAAAALVASAASEAAAWTLPEHMRITAAATAKLDSPTGSKSSIVTPGLAPQVRQGLEDAWALAVSGTVESGKLAKRLCPFVNGSSSGRVGGGSIEGFLEWGEGARASWCIGFAALPGLAADHTCTPKALEEVLFEGSVVRDVLRIGRSTAESFEKAGGDVSKRLDIRRRLDIELAIADALYLNRAKINAAHFEPPRIGSDLGDYIASATAAGETTNAVGLYVNYHAAALVAARRVAEVCSPSGSPRPLAGCGVSGHLVWRALLLEAFALHFLEDSFSSGHFVGSSPIKSWRMGTHDHYCQHGLDARTWAGGTYEANGDAFLKDEDVRRAAFAESRSITQVVRAMTDRTFEAAWARAAPVPEIDVCKVENNPGGVEALARDELLKEVMEVWPMPGMREPGLPKFKSEFGLSAGVSLAIDAGVSPAEGALFRGRGGLRPFGLGMNGIMSRYMDGQAYVEFIGVAERLFSEWDVGFGGRVRAPFAVVPFDSFITLPIMYFTSAVWATTLALYAADGSVYGNFGRIHSLNEDWAAQVVALRDFSFIHYPRSERKGRWEFLLPLFSLTYGRQYSGGITGDIRIDLGAQVAVEGHTPFLGFFLAGSATSAFYYGL